jgi:hypothetical protein
LMRKFRCNLLLPFLKSSFPWNYSNLMIDLSTSSGVLFPIYKVLWIRMSNHSWHYLCSKTCIKNSLRKHVHVVLMSKCPNGSYVHVLRAYVSLSDAAIQHLCISSFCSLTLWTTFFWLSGRI